MPVTPLTKKDGTTAQGNATLTSEEELLLLLAKGKDVLIVLNDQVVRVTIKPFRFEQLPEIMRVTAPIFEALKTDMAANKAQLKAMIETKDFTPVVSFIAKHTDEAFAVINTFEPELSIEDLRTLTADHVADLFLTIVEVNLDFFIKRLTPTLLMNVSRLAQQIPKYGSLLPKN